MLDNLSTLITVMLFCAIAYGAVLAINHLDKPIAKVSIEGDFRYIEQQQFIELVNGQIIGGFITMSTYGVPNELRDALHHGYIHPNLPPPRGMAWTCRGGIWKLIPKGG